jgi:hypothetical protein
MQASAQILKDEQRSLGQPHGLTATKHAQIDLVWTETTSLRNTHALRDGEDPFV